MEETQKKDKDKVAKITRESNKDKGKEQRGKYKDAKGKN